MTAVDLAAERPSLSAALANWAIDLDIADVPADAVRRHLLDALGCAMAAARADAAAPALAVASMDGDGPCRVPGTNLHLPAPAAALATGVLIHALDFDDTHAGGLVHASAPVVATALAVGQAEGRDGGAVLRAIAIGLEVICRLSAAVPHGFHRRGFHATSVCGAPASALVAAILAGSDARTTTHAIGIAVSTAAGSLEFLADGASTKQLHPGLAAREGITAARLAAAGATGPMTALEGRHGLYALYTGARIESASVLDGLGERWEATRITLKPYPACQLVHAGLDAVAELSAREALDPSDITDVQVEVHPDAVEVVCEPIAAKRRPRTPYDAKFSLPWTMATMLVDGAVGVDAFHLDQLDRADLAAMADKVRHVVVDRGGVPAAAAPGRVRIRTADGRERIGVVTASRGGPSTPLDEDTLADKLDANIGETGAVMAIRAAVDGLADAASLGDLLDAVCPTTRRTPTT